MNWTRKSAKHQHSEIAFFQMFVQHSEIQSWMKRAVHLWNHKITRLKPLKEISSFRTWAEIFSVGELTEVQGFSGQPKSVPLNYSSNLTPTTEILLLDGWTRRTELEYRGLGTWEHGLKPTEAVHRASLFHLESEELGLGGFLATDILPQAWGEQV